jgi:hypothetical protein
LSLASQPLVYPYSGPGLWLRLCFGFGFGFGVHDIEALRPLPLPPPPPLDPASLPSGRRRSRTASLRAYLILGHAFFPQRLALSNTTKTPPARSLKAVRVGLTESDQTWWPDQQLPSYNRHNFLAQSRSHLALAGCPDSRTRPHARPRSHTTLGVERKRRELKGIKRTERDARTSPSLD